MSKRKHEIVPTYQESPLKALFAKITNKIQELTLTYPQESSVEYRFAYQFLHQVQELITLFETQCIPLLDNKQTIGVTDGPKINTLVEAIKDEMTKFKDKLVTKEYVLFETLIKNYLPQLIETAIKNSEKFSSDQEKNQYITGFVNTQLDLLKPKLKEELQHIPGTDVEFDSYFDHFKLAMNNLNGHYDNYLAEKTKNKAKGSVKEFYSRLLDKDYDFYPLKNELFFRSGKWTYKEIQVSHPMIADLLIFVHEILIEAPHFIKAIAPFLNPEIFNGNAIRLALYLVAPIKITHASENKPVQAESKTSEQTDSDFHIEFVFKEANAETKTFSEEFLKLKNKTLELISSSLIHTSTKVRDHVNTSYVPDEILELFFKQVYQKTVKQVPLPEVKEFKDVSDSPALDSLMKSLGKIHEKTCYVGRILQRLGFLFSDYEWGEKDFNKLFKEEFPNVDLPTLLLQPKDKAEVYLIESQSTTSKEQQEAKTDTTKPLALKIALLNARFRQVAKNKYLSYQKNFAAIRKSEEEEENAELKTVFNAWNLDHQASLEKFQQEVQAIQENELKPETKETLKSIVDTLAKIKELKDTIDSYILKTKNSLKPDRYLLQDLCNFSYNDLDTPFTKLIKELSVFSDKLLEQNKKIARKLALSQFETKELEEQKELISKKISQKTQETDAALQVLGNQQKTLSDHFKADRMVSVEQAHNLIIGLKKDLNTPIIEAKPQAEDFPTTQSAIKFIKAQEALLADQMQKIPEADHFQDIYTFEKELAQVEGILTKFKKDSPFPFAEINKIFQGNYDQFVTSVRPFCSEPLDETYHQNATKKLDAAIQYLKKLNSSEKRKKETTYQLTLIQALKNISLAKNYRETKPILKGLKTHLLVNREQFQAKKAELSQQIHRLEEVQNKEIASLKIKKDYLSLTIEQFNLIKAITAIVTTKDLDINNLHTLSGLYQKLRDRFEAFKHPFFKEFQDFNSTAEAINVQIRTLGGLIDAWMEEQMEHSFQFIESSLSTFSFFIEHTTEEDFIRNLSTNCRKINKFFNEISKHVHEMKPEMGDEQSAVFTTKLQTRKAKLDNKVSQITNYIIDRCLPLMTGLQNRIEVLGFSENAAEYTADLQELGLLRKEFLGKFSALSLLTQAHSPNPFLAINQQITQTIVSKREIYKSIKIRIRERERLTRELEKGITTYRNSDCNRLEHLQLFSFKNDKSPSVICIELRKALKLYEQHGDHQAVIELITNTLPHCRDIHLKSLLNRTALALLDFNDKKPDYPNTRAKKFTHQAALEKLSSIRDEHHPSAPEKDYVQAMRQLYEKIDELKQFAQGLPEDQNAEKLELIFLADNLNRGVDKFILQNQQPRLEACESLRKNLAFRMHSKDDIMSKHFREWPRILFNILVSPFLLVKIPHSLITTGKVSFFFAQTDKEKKLEALEKEVQKLFPS